jgi:hypothetical protein
MEPKGSSPHSQAPATYPDSAHSSLKSKAVFVQALMAYGFVEVQLNSFSISALDWE